MDSLPSDFAISLKACPTPTTNGNISSLLPRINSERGGFQNITEESLREEIAEAELENEDGDESMSDEGEEELDRVKEVQKAREEILAQIESAHQSAGFALEFISLLLSKDTPVQATISLSPFLRETVGLGTLGADKLNAPRITEAQKQDNKAIAYGWKSQSTYKSIDSILASATRLEKEIETETQYWENVLAISDKGWSVCRLPNEKHVLGVRFGFSEAAPAFRNRSLAALRRNPDGTVSFDQGLAGSEPQTLRVRIQTGKSLTGSSKIPESAAENAPVEDLILQARNTIFSEELWHELNREARILGASGVQSKGDTLICPLSSTKTAILDLVPLGEPTESGPDDNIAEGVFLSMNLLLSYAHRQNLKRRSQEPAAIRSKKPTALPYIILRGILIQLKHQETMRQMTMLLSLLRRVAASAKVIPTPTFTLTPRVGPPGSVPKAEQTIASMIHNLEAKATLSFSETTILEIIARTTLTPITSSYQFSLSPESPLMVTCPPPLPPIALTSYPALRDFLLYFTSCTISSSIPVNPSIEDEETQEGWLQTQHPTTLRLTSTASKPPRTKTLALSMQSLSSALEPSKYGVRLRAQWEISGEEQSFREHGRKSSFGYPVLMDDSSKDGMQGLVEEREAKKKFGGAKGEGVYDWVAWEGKEDEWEEGEGVLVKSLAQVVAEAGR